MDTKKLNLKYLFYVGLGTTIQKMGLRQASRLGHLVGELMWISSPSRRKIAIGALKSHLGISNAAATDIARRSFWHTGISFVEMFLSRQVDFRFTAGNVSCNRESLFKRMVGEKRPIVATTGHLGSWELLAPILALHLEAKERQIIVKHPKDKALAQVMIHCRGVGGNQILGKDQAAPSVLHCLRQNGLSAFLVDHNTHRNKSIFLPFLGQKASVNIGPAVVAVRSKALVWPIFLLRNGRGKYHLNIQDPLDTTLLQGKFKNKVIHVADFYNQAVETLVQRFPEQWFWMQKRWKTRPLEEKNDWIPPN